LTRYARGLFTFNMVGMLRLIEAWGAPKSSGHKIREPVDTIVGKDVRTLYACEARRALHWARARGQGTPPRAAITFSTHPLL
jgi:hypothetical protein